MKAALLISTLLLTPSVGWAQTQSGEFGPSSQVLTALASINPQTENSSVALDRNACTNPEGAVDAVVQTFLSLSATQRTPTRIRNELITEYRARVARILRDLRDLVRR